MELLTKKYKHLKIKNHFKNFNFLLIYNGIDIKYFVKTNQKLKALNINYYRIYNHLAKKSFKNSIFKNLQPLINNTVIIIRPNIKEKNFVLSKYYEFNESLYLIGLKINNKIYPIYKLNKVLQLNYKKDYLILIKFLNNQLKVFYKLT